MSTSKIKGKPAGPADKGVRVFARSPQGFRRAGRAWSAEGETVPLSELTEGELEALRAESQLIVVDVDLAPAKAKA